MHRAAIIGSVLSVAFPWSAGRSAHAAVGDRPHLDERTTLMPIVERVSIAADRPAWPVRVFAPLLVPTLRLEVSLLERAPVPSLVPRAGYFVAIEGRGSPFGSADLNDVGIRAQVAPQAVQPGTVFEVPLTSIFSVTVLARYQLHTGQRRGEPDR